VPIVTSAAGQTRLKKGEAMNRAAAVNTVAVNVLWALAVCVLAVTLAVLLVPVLSSEAVLEWLTTTPPCGGSTG